VDVTDASFDALVLKAPVAVLLYVWADWSEPCSALTPRLEALVRGAKGVLRLAKVNVDNSPQLARALNASVPALLAVIGGKLLGAIASFDDKAISEFVRAVLQAADAQGLVPGGGGNVLEHAADTVRDAHNSVDAGKYSEALSMSRSALATVQIMRSKLADQLQSAAASDAKAQQALATSSMSGPLYELDNLAARAAAAAGQMISGYLSLNDLHRCHSPRSYLAVRALLALSMDASSSGPHDADPRALRTEAYGLVETLRTQYRAHTSQAEVHRALAAAELLDGATQGMRMPASCVLSFEALQFISRCASMHFG
jgi:thiol-disulfide isomerase/thioredoxin